MAFRRGILSGELCPRDFVQGGFCPFPQNLKLSRKPTTARVIVCIPAQRSCRGSVRGPTGSYSRCSRSCPGARRADIGHRSCVSWSVCCRCRQVAACRRHQWRNTPATSNTVSQSPRLTYTMNDFALGFITRLTRSFVCSLSSVPYELRTRKEQSTNRQIKVGVNVPRAGVTGVPLYTVSQNNRTLVICWINSNKSNPILIVFGTKNLYLLTLTISRYVVKQGTSWGFSTGNQCRGWRTVIASLVN